MTAANVASKLAVAGTSPTLVRPRFAAGMLLKHEDLEQLNAYTRELSRLLFRSFFGCGVVCGLVVEMEEDDCGRMEVTVDAGVALACSGDPIHVAKKQRLAIDPDCDPDLTGPLWVVLCAHVKCCAPRPSACSCEEEDEHPTCTRERDGFEIRVVSTMPECLCGGNPEYKLPESVEGAPEAPVNLCQCVDPHDQRYEDHYNGNCGCECGVCAGTCSCDCVLLARLKEDDGEWTVEHGVRRFVRPVLMRDPQVAGAMTARSALRRVQIAAADKLNKELEDKAKAMAREIIDLQSREVAAREEERREVDAKARHVLVARADKMATQIRELRKRESELVARLEEQKRAKQQPKAPRIRKP